MCERKWEVNCTKVYMTDDGTFIEYSIGVTLVYINLFLKFN
jgi:hypothetical protein